MRVERSDINSVKEKLNSLKRNLNTKAGVTKLSAIDEYNNRVNTQILTEEHINL
jgi:hypothetical protein